MREEKEIISIEFDRLVGHPANPNRMSTETLAKLKSHIGRTGNYEPIIVRRHPKRSGFFEILNGHHRITVLKALGYESADCVVWRVDDDEALVLLATLNRLCGSDDVHNKLALFKNLSRKFSTKELSKMLIDGRKVIERLTNLKTESRPVFSRAFLNPATFFLTDAQKRILDEALIAAMKVDKGKTKAQRRAQAIAEIARSFINRTSYKKAKQ